MKMSINLSKYLKILHESLPGNTYGITGDGSHAVLIAGDIARECQLLNTDSDVANACSVLFHENDGIISFVRRCISHDQFGDARSKLVEFILDFIERCSAIVLSYAIEIKDACLLIFNHDNKAKVRINVLRVIIKLLELSSGKQVGIDLNPLQIMDRFYFNLSKTSKISPTVLQVILELLGILVENFPEYVSHYSDRLLKAYLARLNQQMKSKTKSPEFPIICGCFSGLISILNTNSQRLSDSDRDAIYGYISLAIQYNKDVKRFEYIRVVLHLFARHASLFNDQIYKDWLRIFENLKEWSLLSNRTVKYAAISATESYLKQMAVVLCRKLDSAEDRTEAERIFKFFAATFCKILGSNESASVAMAVQGYGYFAAPCKRLTNTNEVTLMFTEVINRCEDLFFSEHGLVGETLDYLPSFVTALASIILQLDEVSEVFLLPLENLVVRLIENYPKVIPQKKHFSHNAIIKLCIALYPKGTVFRPFIQKIVYQGILRTCMHPIPQELASDATLVTNENDSVAISYRNYLDLWKNMLQIVKLKELNEIGVSIADRQIVTYAIYDGVISSVLAIIEKLDFSLAKISPIEIAQPNELSSDPIVGLHASKPEDFQIFVNLVEFCKILLLDGHLPLFKRWIYTFGHSVISFSTKFPLVSGFYKLFAVVLKICSRVNYFSKIERSEFAANSKAINFNMKYKSLVLFSKCAKEIAVRLQQYKEDLLTSCFQVILSLPIEIVTDILTFVIPVVEKAISLGYGYLPLVDDVLTALEYWSSGLSPDVLQPLYRNTLPLLNGYLAAFSKPFEVSPWIKEKKKTSVRKRTNDQGNLENNLTPSILQVKIRIIKLLGNLGGDVNSILIDDRSESIGKVALSWDSNKLMKFAVPFMDMKPTIYLDPFLPKVVDLACSSSDRQTKIAASELLHALILYLLGSRAALQPELQMETPMTKLLTKLFPAVVKLSCEIDMVVHQLFKPLLFQLIHWFSRHRREILNDQTTLFDSLMDGVTSASDTTLRDLCAQGIGEFLVWTVKHSSISHLKRNPYGTKFILKRMYTLCLHPKSSLRLGAALIFNNIYTVFREEQVLVDRFIFEILYYFVESLAIADKDEKHLGTRDQCLTALNHVEKIILAKMPMLKKKNPARRKPLEFQNFETKGSDWDQLLLWLLNQFGRPESECRHRCMEFINKFTGNADARETSAYFKTTLEHKGVNYFISIFEGDKVTAIESPHLVNFPKMTDYLKKYFAVSDAVAWLQLLLGSLDCYTWVIGNNFLKSNDLFEHGTQSVLLKAVHYFHSEVALKDIFAMAGCCNSSTEDNIFTPSEISEYGRMKCTVIVRVIDFIEMVITHSADTSVSVLDNLIDLSFWKMIISCVLHPLEVGFDMDDLDVSVQLPVKIKGLLQAVVKHLPQRFIGELETQLSNEIDISQSWTAVKQFSNYDTNRDREQWTTLRWLTTGFKLLNQLNILKPTLSLSGDQITQLGQTFANMAVEMSISQKNGVFYANVLEKHELSVAQELLHLSFSFGLSVRTLIDLLADQSIIRHSNGQNEFAKGEHILVTFSSEMSAYIMENSSVSIPYLMSNMAKQQMIYANILVAVLDYLADDSKLRVRFVDQVVEKVLLSWSELHSWWHHRTSIELKRVLLHILIKTLVLGYKLSFSKDRLLYLSALDTFLSLLLDPNLNLKFKGRALDLLPIFAGLPSEHLFELKKHLVKMAVMHFPLRCSEIPVKSPQYIEYVTMFKKILFALELSGSLMILEFVIELVCVEPKHVCDELIQNTLAAHMKRCNYEKQSLTIDVVFNIFKSGAAEQEEFRQAVIERFLAPLLEKASKVVFTNFYVKNIKTITISILEKPVKSSDSNYQIQLVSKLCSLKLVTILYNRCSGQDLNTLESSINDAYCDGAAKTGKELTQEVTRAAHNIKKENMKGESAFLELRRRCHCAAYNCLAAVISCTQTDVKFYTGLLFTENTVKGEFLWENLIDVNKHYSFQIELDSVLEKRKTLSTIRHTFREGKLPEDNSEEVMDVEINPSFLISQSSLADDVSMFDLSSSTQVRDSSSNKKSRSSRKTDDRSLHSDSFMELEMDLLNQHECMITMNGLVRHLHDCVTPATLNPTDMPSWMKAMHKKFCDETTPVNVKLFFGRLIINNDKVFEPFASFWLYPLMQIIVEGASGKGMSYFVVDLVVVMLSWSSTALPANTMMERSMTTRLLEFLIKNANHDRREIMRNNLEVIKTVIECWKTRLDIPSQIIFDHFNGSKLDSKENEIGIQLIGIIVSCGLPPYSSTLGLDEERFLNSLIQNVNHKLKGIYSLAAEVTGLILKFIGSREKAEDFQFYQAVRKQLSKLEANMDQFLVCIYQVQKGFPAIVDSFSQKIVFHLPKTRGIFREISLKTLLSRVEMIEGLYVELKSVGLYKFLTHDGENVQCVCLMIVNKVIDSLSREQILDVFDLIASFADHPDLNCRRVMFEIFIKIFNQFSENESDVVDRTKRALLKGIGDPDTNLRLFVLNFWGHDKRLPTETLERVLAILANLYLPECEKHFLATSTYLVLELTSKSPDYTRLIFEHPLSDCKFENYNVIADWRVRHASMMPLFVETMTTDSIGPTSFAGFEPHTQQIRATQDNLAFTPTQDVEQKTFDWTTQSSVDIFATNSSTLEDDTSSRLIINPKHSKVSFNKSTPDESLNTDESDKTTLSLLKRRFLKNVEMQRKFYIQRNVKLQQRRDILAQEQKLARESKVAMFRQYRKGDLPDIQIPYSSVIAPLQALAQRDDEIAQMLFTNLVISVVEEATVDTDRKREAITSIETSLNEMLKQTFIYTPCIIIAIQEIGLHFCGALHLDISLLATASEHSFQQNRGILLLEKTISQSFKPEASSSENRLKSVYENKELWVMLARLNRSQGNYDVVNGIVSYHFGLPQTARDAFVAEARGDYALALNLMKKFHIDVQSGTKEEADQSECDLWNNSILLCYDKLCQWDKLNNWTVKCFDQSNSGTGNFDLIWSDSNPELYMEYLIRANVKLIMDGVNNQPFVDFLDNSMADLEHPEKRQYLESRFSHELALLSVVQKDYNRAWHYVALSQSHFIHYWSSISVLSSGNRRSHLEKLQSLTEMDNFLQTMKSSVSNFSHSVVSLIKLWCSNLPGSSSNVKIIYDIISNRSLYMKRLEGEIASKSCEESQIEEHNSENIQNLFGQSRFAFSMNCVEAASSQRNFPLALSQLKDSMNISKKISDDSLQIKWILAYCRTHQRNSIVQEGDKKVKSLLNVWTNLDKCVTDEESYRSFMLDVNLIHSQNADLFVKYFKEDPSLLEVVDREQSRSFRKRINCGVSSKLDEVVNGLVHYSYHYLKDAVGLCVDTDKDRKTINVADAHLQLAKFCDRFLKEYDASDSSNPPKFVHNFQSLASEVIEHLLKSIKHGSEEGIQLFPRLLQILELFPGVSDIFIKIVKEIPVWMFLRWNSQLVALLDKPCAPALHHLLISIAETYPLALVYNFNVSKQGFQFETTKQGRHNKTVLAKLQCVFDRLWLVNHFILALEQLNHPRSRFLDFYGSCDRRNKDEFLKSYRQFYDEVIIKPETDTQSVIPYGKVAKSFAKEFKSVFQQLFGRDNVKLKTMELQDILKELLEIKKNKIEQSESIGPKLLKDYCEWLAMFSGAKFGVELEIPGQYTGHRKPLPEYHTLISKFNETAEVMQSVRRPKAITVVGNDCKEYKYLVKSGEDLRLDQRIQQLFDIMNGIYSRDGPCHSRQLRIITYQVVPLTNRLGWLEWAPNTVPLKAFLERGMDGDETQRYERCGSAMLKFIKKFSSAKDVGKMYGDFYLKCELDAAVRNYNDIVNDSPKDALKKSFWKISASPEAFITLRNRFIVSHAVLSVSQYILGIGDRHLSNFVVSLNTGEMLGIDFGHSFGSATSFLPIPELMPFRLTPQFLNLMEPMREHGLLQSTMVQVLNALRNNPDILINTMDVFIKEPSLDWEELATRQMSNSSPRGKSVGSSWYPKQRIGFAIEKLNGRNSAYIMIDELNCGGKREKVLLEKYKEVCLGNQNSKLRAKLRDEKLSVEKQVLCLLDHATDSHILSKAFCGWSSWM